MNFIFADAFFDRRPISYYAAQVATFTKSLMPNIEVIILEYHPDFESTVLASTDINIAIGTHIELEKELIAASHECKYKNSTLKFWSKKSKGNILIIAKDYELLKIHKKYLDVIGEELSLFWAKFELKEVA